MIRSKGQVQTGREDPCEAPPIIIKNTVKFKIRQKLGMTGAGIGTGIVYIKVTVQKVNHVLSNKIAEGSSS